MPHVLRSLWSRQTTEWKREGGNSKWVSRLHVLFPLEPGSNLFYAMKSKWDILSVSCPAARTIPRSRFYSLLHGDVLLKYCHTVLLPSEKAKRWSPKTSFSRCEWSRILFKSTILSKLPLHIDTHALFHYLNLKYLFISVPHHFNLFVDTPDV